MLRGLRVLFPGLLLTVWACSHSGGGEVRPAREPVSVEVTNRHALPMEIYAVGSGISHRLGTVNPGLSSHFVLPQNLIGSSSVQLEARAGTSGQPFRSGEILMAPGSVVDFVIGSRLFNSTVTLRP
ncbi:MAG TPA: hypothetical protein VNO19_09685 [Gemmatimonadales bacterium]|nr:hypothetical protein [Gemmatimonadales bacterium]